MRKQINTVVLPPQYGCLLSPIPGLLERPASTIQGARRLPDHLDQEVPGAAHLSPPNSAGAWKERKDDNTLIMVAPRGADTQLGCP